MPKLHTLCHVSLTGRQTDGAKKVVHGGIRGSECDCKITRQSRCLLLGLGDEAGPFEGVLSLSLCEHRWKFLVGNDVYDLLPRFVLVLRVGEVDATLDQGVYRVIHADPAIRSAVPLGTSLSGDDIPRNDVLPPVLFNPKPASLGVSPVVARSALFLRREAHEDGGTRERGEDARQARRTTLWETCCVRGWVGDERDVKEG